MNPPEGEEKKHKTNEVFSTTSATETPATTETSEGGTDDAVTTGTIPGTKRTHIPDKDASENLSCGNTNMEKAYLCMVLITIA